MSEHVYQEMTPHTNIATHTQVPASRSTTPTGSLNQSDNVAIILVGTNDRLLSISPAAADLVGLSPDKAKGQHLSVLGESLAAVAKQPTRPGASNFLQLDNGNTVLANTRTVVGRNNQPMGWAVTLQDISSAVHEFRSRHPKPAPAIGDLQDKMKSMQELIDMLPRFSHHKYWQNLLVEHMQRLMTEMNSQINEMTPMSA